MAKRQFKAESKRLLDLMINSIYTHKEIFLRELISNASDALDKLYFLSLTDHESAIHPDEFCIRLALDRDKRTLTITDNGIGMTKEELENNLGVIAKSGSYDYKQQNPDDHGEIIGQFGVGFYSAFMVSEKVTVLTKAYGSDQAYRWESSGVDGYTIKEAEKDTIGTTIELKIKPKTEDEDYDDFLKEFRLEQLVKKYSDYIRYPIKMEMTNHRLKEGSDTEYELYTEDKTLNSMVPIWKKNKSELKQEDYDSFYQEKFMDFNKPLKTLHFKTEGTATYHALLFLPEKPPFDYYSKNYEKGLQLYSNGVLIMEKCADLLPDYFSFVKGLVDSEDLSLNISREMLQHDRQLQLMAKNIDKRLKSELKTMMKNDRETYEKLYQSFGQDFKYGIYNNYGAEKDELKDFVLFYSSFEGQYTSLHEYVERMPQDQKEIYYACGDSVEKIRQLPQMERVQEKGYEVLYLTEKIDEFVVKSLFSYEDKSFQSITSEAMDLDSEEEKKELDEQKEEHKDLLEFIQKELEGKVATVSLSHRLKSSPVCLTASGDLSLEMEKVLNAMPNASAQKVAAEKVLELNAAHPVFGTLCKLWPDQKDRMRDYAWLLYDQAALIAGVELEDPAAFSNRIASLMVEFNRKTN